MTKNITVIGENGNILYSTYPKRADGLVKKGRAQQISDTAIRLCAFPEAKKEENEMAVNIYELFDNQLSKMQEQLRDDYSDNAAEVRTQILKTLETLKTQEQTDKVIDIIKTHLDTMQASLAADTAPENSAAREVTRQKMLELMEKLLVRNADK